MLLKFIFIVLTISIMGCGSTSKQVNQPTQQLNNGIAKLVKYKILDVELADMMALQEKQNQIDDNNRRKDGALSSLTGDGALVGGYMLSSVLGAGLSLGDFLSPANIILSGFTVRKEWKKHETNVLFIEVPDSCSEKCAVAKLSEIALKQKELAYKKMGLQFPKNKTIHVLESGGFYNYHLFDDDGEILLIFTLTRPEFFYVNGKRYYGGNPTTKKPSDSRWYLGTNAIEHDMGLAALVEISSDYPELFTYVPKQFISPTYEPNPEYVGCRGNFIVQGGQIELLYQMFGCYAFAEESNIPADSLVIYL